MLSTGVLKSLGMLYDISAPNLHETQFHATKLRAQKSCNIISRTRGAAKNLRSVVSSVIVKRVEYTGKFAAWTAKQYEELDDVFTHMYKQMSANNNSYPTSLARRAWVSTVL